MSNDMPATSGAARAAEARRRADEHAAEARKWERLAANYEKGDEGERRTAKLLDIIDGAGWVVLNDRYKSAASPANIDHIVVGPSGVCVIDTKNWSGRVAVDQRGFSSNGFRREDELQALNDSWLLVAHAARRSVPEALTARVFCFADDVGLTEHVFEHGVVFIQHDQLLPWLTTHPRRLSPSQVARLGAHLDAEFPPRSGPRRPPRWTTPRPTRVRPAPTRATRARPATRQTAPGNARRGLFLALGALLTVLVLPKMVVAIMTSNLPKPASPPAHSTPR